MTSESRPEKVSWGFQGVLVGSRVFRPLRWLMLEKVAGGIASRCWPYLVAKSSHAGADVVGLTCPLHCPMGCNHWMMGHGFLLGAVLSHQAAAGGGALLGVMKSPGLNIYESVDRLGTCVIEFYMEHIAFTRICIPG
jgi:aldehyde:ferredoxin oxidoreductase